MVTTNIPNSRLKSFQTAVEAGQVLFMVDIPSRRVDGVHEMMKIHRPEADMRNIEPTMPAFS